VTGTRTSRASGGLTIRPPARRLWWSFVPGPRASAGGEADAGTDRGAGWFSLVPRIGWPRSASAWRSRPSPPRPQVQRVHRSIRRLGLPCTAGAAPHSAADAGRGCGAHDPELRRRLGPPPRTRSASVCLVSSRPPASTSSPLDSGALRAQRPVPSDPAGADRLLERSRFLWRLIRAKRDSGDTCPAWPEHLVRIQLSIVFFYAALDKVFKPALERVGHAAGHAWCERSRVRAGLLQRSTWPSSAPSRARSAC